MDGTSNDDVASLTNPKDLKSIGLKGNPVVGLNYEKEGDLSYWADTCATWTFRQHHAAARSSGRMEGGAASRWRR